MLALLITHTKARLGSLTTDCEYSDSVSSPTSSPPSTVGSASAMKNTTINLTTGRITGRMKFNQRLFILFGATFFSFAFFLLFDQSMPWPQQQISRTRLLAIKLWPNQLDWQPPRHRHHACSWSTTPSIDRIVTANFSTFDMIPKLVYDVMADGSYPLPNPNKALDLLSLSSSSLSSSLSSSSLSKSLSSLSSSSSLSLSNSLVLLDSSLSSSPSLSLSSSSSLKSASLLSSNNAELVVVDGDDAGDDDDDDDDDSHHSNVDGDGPGGGGGAVAAADHSRDSISSSSSSSSSSSKVSEDGLTVIVVPHSHNDPGWLKTVDEYYSDQTKHILDNIVQKLTTYPNMTFVWSETIYLAMWWNDQEDAIKAQVRRLIRRGQLEIVLGGWVMPDEATTHYYAIVDQLIEGHRWVMDNLHVIPENSWSIDAFGHSGTMPYLLKEAGLKNMVIQRIHGAVKGYLAKRKSLEFNWRQYWDPKGTKDMMCHTMPYMLYSIKYTCGPDKFFCLLYDFRNIPGERREGKSREITMKNIEIQAEYLYKEYMKKNFLYKYNVILVPLGDDFRYDKELEWDQQYQNYMMLFHYMNSRRDWNIKLRFGTLRDYFDIVRKRQLVYPNYFGDDSLKLPSLSGDFFPYSDKNYDYWTGFYTTRPFDKRFSRNLESYLRAADILYFLACSYSSIWDVPYEKSFEAAGMLKRARRYLGLFQHHDAITGTAKDNVVLDYEEKLAISYNLTQTVIGDALEILLYRSKNGPTKFVTPETVRISPTTSPQKQILRVDKAGLRLILFNQLLQQRQDIVTVLVSTNNIEVLDESKNSIPCQINPYWTDHTTVSNSVFELVFLANMAPLASTVYTLQIPIEEPKNTYLARIGAINHEHLVIPSTSGFVKEKPWFSSNPESIVLENSIIKATFSGSRGLLQEVVDKTTGNSTQIKLDFLAYLSQGSGAYLFLPNGRARSITNSKHIVRVVRGPLVSEVHVLHKYILHRIKLYDVPGLQRHALHIENTVNIKSFRDREVIMRLQTDIKNPNQTFFTDQNGFQMIGRRNQPRLHVEANYYPVTTMVMLEDDLRRLSLHVDHSHGVACLETGMVEVMLDRQLSYDDERGLGQGVEDIKPVISKFVLHLEPRYKGKQSTSNGDDTVNNKHNVKEDTLQFDSEATQRHEAAQNINVDRNKDGISKTLVRNSDGNAQNIKMNLPISNTFASYTDSQKSSIHTQELRFTYPSLLGIYLNYYLQHPLITYFTNMPSEKLAPTFLPIDGQIPCDINILSLRVLVNSDLVQNGSSLILNREGFSCEFPTSEPVCSSNWGQFPVNAMFGKIPLKSFRRTSLSHLYDLETLSPNSVLKLAHMEVSSYILKT
ncbi:alpha-mannosidase 2 isoform X2 [Octopus bimaculoides]|uniref:alpha-mannosidase 2 isoform X2 n=1 Tax=Octopus bimaculoides TaxID=37653 RepID=UPI0022E24EF7|nr:alpha-mannosidase 2 isoform X2 [Octopus bimaculoides]